MLRFLRPLVYNHDEMRKKNSHRIGTHFSVDLNSLPEHIPVSAV